MLINLLTRTLVGADLSRTLYGLPTSSPGEGQHIAGLSAFRGFHNTPLHVLIFIIDLRWLSRYPYKKVVTITTPPFLHLTAISSRTLRTHNEHRQPGGMQNPFGYTSHHQAF
jgi:hypothetical protein